MNSIENNNSINSNNNSNIFKMNVRGEKVSAADIADFVLARFENATDYELDQGDYGLVFDEALRLFGIELDDEQLSNDTGHDHEFVNAASEMISDGFEKLRESRKIR